MALPTALFAMIASMALASAALLSSVDVQQGTTRDHESKEAIAAADAGASVAMLRMNRFLPELSVANQCVGPNGEYQEPSAGWCPVTAAQTVAGATFTYQVSAFTGNGEMSVVSTGTSGTVSRRVNVGMVAYSHKTPFAEEKVVGQENIHMRGNPEIRTDIGTNGNIEGEGTPTLCGNARHGVGRKDTWPPSCNGEETEGNEALPPVAAPENIATENSDCRLVPNCTNESGELDTRQVDTYSKRRTSTNPWEEGVEKPGTINVAQNASLTMGGNDYFVCGLYLNSGQLIMAAGEEVHVRIFVDTPEHCGLSSGATQVEFTGNGTIESTGFNNGQSFNVPEIFLLGNGTVRLNGDSGTNELVLYAPESEVEMRGNATYKGMIAGKSLNISGNPRIESDPRIPEPAALFQSLLQRTRYVECTGTGVSPPNAGC
jgi:hypothetical protein